MLYRIGICLVLCSLGWPSQVTSQDDLASMCESWAKCNKDLTEKFEALDAGDVTPGLADDYRDLVDEANNLIKSMRAQGVAELKEKPGDGKVISALLGIMVHDAQSGRDNMVLDVGQSLIDARINPLYFEQAAKVDSLEPSQKHVFDELAVRHKETMADDLPRVKLTTTAGEIVLELFENESPNTVRNFITLVESGYYSDKLFHRVIENFMAQGGGYETEGIGSGGPGYQIECECREADARRNFTGTISMAHAGRDTGGGQFFINFKYNDGLDRKHTVFGRIISGADVLDKIERTHISVNDFERRIEQAKPEKIVSAEVIRKRDHSYRVRKKGESVAEFEMKEKAEADKKAKAKAEAEAKAKAEAEAKMKAEAEAKAKAKAEAEAKAKEEAEAKKKAEAEEKAKAEAAKKEKAEADKAKAAEETKSNESETKKDDDSESEADEDKS